MARPYSNDLGGELRRRGLGAELPGGGGAVWGGRNECGEVSHRQRATGTATSRPMGGHRKQLLDCTVRW